MRTEAEKRELVSKRLWAALLVKQNKAGRRISQREIARSMGFRQDSSFSDFLNKLSLPGTDSLEKLARDPDIGYAIYDDMELPRPIQNDPLIRETIRLSQEDPAFREILEFLAEHPEDKEKYKKFMIGLRALGKNSTPIDEKADV